MQQTSDQHCNSVMTETRLPVDFNFFNVNTKQKIYCGDRVWSIWKEAQLSHASRTTIVYLNVVNPMVVKCDVTSVYTNSKISETPAWETFCH